MKYIIITAPRLIDLMRDVNNHTKTGWIPTGGVMIAVDGYTYVQALYAKTGKEA